MSKQKDIAIAVPGDDEPRYAGLREVATMAGPVVLGSISVTTMGVVDTAMVGRLGTAELAAVGSAGLWSFTLATFFIGLVSCVGTFVSQCVGREDYGNCARYAWQGIHFSLGTYVVAALAFPFSTHLFAMMPHEANVQQFESDYFRIRMYTFGLMPLQAALSAFFNAINRPKVSMVASVGANLMNAFLDYVLIFGKFGFPELRTSGAAWATNASIFAQCAIMMGVFLAHSSNSRYGTRTAWPFDMAKTRELVRIGWGGGMAFLLDLFTWSVFTSVIVGGVSAVAMAAHNTAIQIMSVSFMPAVGVNHAIAPIVGQWIGRGNIARAKARTYTAMKITMLYMFVMGVVFAVLGAPIIRYGFNDHPEVVRIGAALLIMAAIFQLFDAVNIVVLGALRGAGDTRWTAIAMTTCAFTVFLPVAYVLAHVVDWGAIGAWVGATVYIIVLSFFMFARWRGERWRYIQIFDADLAAAGAAASDGEKAQVEEQVV